MFISINIYDHSHIQYRFLEIRDDYGANASIMTEYLKAGKIKPSPKLATGLFYGVKTDTHNFAVSAKPNDINAFKYHDYPNA